MNQTTHTEATARIAYLREKLVGSGTGKPKLTDIRRHEVNEKVRQISDKIERSKDADVKTFDSINQRLLQLAEVASRLRQQREEVETKKQRDLRDIGHNFAREVQLEYEGHIQKTNQLDGKTGGKLEILKFDINSEKTIKRKKLDDLRQAIVQDYEGIKEDLVRQKRERETVFEDLISKLGGDLVSIRQVLIDERQDREDSHSNILRSIKYMKDRFAQMGDQESARRRQDQLDLIKLFEQIAVPETDKVVSRSTTVNYQARSRDKQEYSQTRR